MHLPAVVLVGGLFALGMGEPIPGMFGKPSLGFVLGTNTASIVAVSFFTETVQRS
jgi:hypothetical protein